MAHYGVRSSLGTVYVDKAGNPTNERGQSSVVVGAGADIASELSSVSTVLSVTTSLSTVGQALSTTISTAVADGASPTQAHVSSILSSYTIERAGLSSALSAETSLSNVQTSLSTSLTGDLLVNWDASKITSVTKLKAAFAAALQAAIASGTLTD